MNANIQQDIQCLQQQDPQKAEYLKKDAEENTPKLVAMWNTLGQVEEQKNAEATIQQIVDHSWSTTRAGTVYNRMQGGRKNNRKAFKGGANSMLVRALVWLTIAAASGATMVAIYQAAVQLGIFSAFNAAVEVAEFTVQGCGTVGGIAARNQASSLSSYFFGASAPSGLTCSNAVLQLEQAQNALNAQMQVWMNYAGITGVSGGFALLGTKYNDLYNAIDNWLDSKQAEGTIQVDEATGKVVTACKKENGGKRKSRSLNNKRKNKRTVNRKKNNRKSRNKKSKNNRKSNKN